MPESSSSPLPIHRSAPQLSSQQPVPTSRAERGGGWYARAGAPGEEGGLLVEVGEGYQDVFPYSPLGVLTASNE